MNFQGHRNEFAAVNEHEVSFSPAHVFVRGYSSDFKRTWMLLHLQLFCKKCVQSGWMHQRVAHIHTCTHGWLQFCFSWKAYSMRNIIANTEHITHLFSQCSAYSTCECCRKKNNRITWTNDRPNEQTTMRMQRENSSSGSKHTEIYASKYYKLKHIFPILFSCWRTAVGIVHANTHTRTNIAYKYLSV